MSNVDVRVLSSTHTIFNAMGLDVELLGNPAIDFHRAKIAEWLSQWDIVMGTDHSDLLNGHNILDQLDRADKLEGLPRSEAIAKAYRKASSLYYGLWAKGKIKQLKTPMPDDVKEMLREKARPEIMRPEVLLETNTTVRQIEKLGEFEVEQLHQRVFGNVKQNHQVETRRRHLISAILQLIREEKRPKHATDDEPAVTAPDPKPRDQKPSRTGKTPIYADKVAQKEKEAAYPWIKPGSWRKDPEKESGTILEIICEVCGAERTIHAADAFQVKRCKACKKSKPSKEA